MIGPVLSSAARAEFERAIELFNEGRYHDALDAFEGPYHRVARPDGQLFLGLVRASAAMYHFEGGRFESARRLYRSSREVLTSVVDAVAGVDVAGLIAELDGCFKRLLEASAVDIASVRPDRRPQIIRVDHA